MDLSILDGFDINSVVQILILCVISMQLFVIVRVFKADHERRKKQATVEFINEIRTHYRGITNNLIEKFGSNSVRLDEIDASVKNEIRDLLSLLEHMSVGINTGVYDFDILVRMSGSYLVSRYHQLYPYIYESQKRTPTFYIEFETLCKKIESKKKSIYGSTSGNITKSS